MEHTAGKRGKERVHVCRRSSGLVGNSGCQQERRMGKKEKKSHGAECIAYYACTSPVSLPTCLPPLLSPSPPVSLPTCLPPRLSPSPLVSLPSCLPHHLSPSPPVSLPTCAPCASWLLIHDDVILGMPGGMTGAALEQHLPLHWGPGGGEGEKGEEGGEEEEAEDMEEGGVGFVERRNLGHEECAASSLWPSALPAAIAARSLRSKDPSL